MEFKLSQNQLTIMQEKSKLFTYLSTTLTRAYLGVGDGAFSVMLRGSKGVAKLSVPADIEEPLQIVSVDYTKWLNALSKLSFADEVKVKLTAKSLSISIEGSRDVIALGITASDDSSEKDIFNNFVERQKKENNYKEVELTEDFVDALNITSGMFSTVGKNNAILLRDSSLLYADRSIILKVNLEQTTAFKHAEMHRFTAKLLPLLYKFSNKVLLAEDLGYLLWEDMHCEVAIASEACDIAVPTEEELKEISPQYDKGTLRLSNVELLAGLNFFDGFYEASAWKPITIICKNGKASLYYNHPSTEITKELEEASVEGEGTFIVASETLAKLVAHSADNKQDVVFRFDDEAPGVACSIGDSYEVVFAKLVE